MILPTPMAHIIEIRQGIKVLDALTSASIVDRALRNVGLSRRLLRGPNRYLPYALEAKILEQVARKVGERHFGISVGSNFDYSGYEEYSKYVLSAPDLLRALIRARLALSILHPGSDLCLERQDDTFRLSFASGISSIVGARHLEESSLFQMMDVCRFFLGASWRPVRIELPRNGNGCVSAMEQLLETGVQIGADSPAVIVRTDDLARINPALLTPDDYVTLKELPYSLGVKEPRSTRDAILHTLQTQLLAHDLTEDGTAKRLSMQVRTLQRRLREEGTSFREVKAQFVEARARALLSETDFEIAQIADHLGYSEPNSFRRAFRFWTGVSPARYRDATRA